MFLTWLTEHIARFAAILITVGFLSIAAAAQEYRNGFTGVALDVGSEPTARLNGSQPLRSTKMIGAVVIWNRPNLKMRLMVFSNFKTGGLSLRQISAAVMNEWIDAYVESISQASAPCQRKPWSLNTFKGYQVECTGQQRTLARVFAVDDQLVMLDYRLVPGEDNKRATAIFDSFRLLTREERNIASIQQSMPPKLDQEPPEHLPMSDAAADGLIGPVRRVKDVTKPSEQHRPVIETETSYDRTGFRASQIRYNGGYAELITTWGWLEGRRVDFQSAVHYAPGERIAMFDREDVVGGILYDPEHTSRYGTIYDLELDRIGRVIKRTRYSVEGSIVTIETVTFTGNVRRRRLSGADGTFGSDVEEKLDERGNVVDRKIFMASGQVFQHFAYTYVFDETGNWVKRTETVVSPSIKRRMNRSKYSEVTTREILYYDDKPTKRLS